MMLDTIITGDCLPVLKSLPSSSVHCCVTSPPYYALRDYEAEGQIGREGTPEEYIGRLVDVFREVRRMLKFDGTFWLNIADTYCKSSRHGCKKKDMLGIPWRLALALREDGWYLRSDIIWVKGNAMPESVKDRCTRSYEHVFLLTKSKHYYFDHAAIAEPVAPATIKRMKSGRSGSGKYAAHVPGQPVQAINLPKSAGSIMGGEIPTHRNKRDVWNINTVPYAGAHFAAFPPKLAETCILAGCPAHGIVLDPFFGSGTTGLAAKQNGRHFIGVEINPRFCKLAEERVKAGLKHQKKAEGEPGGSLYCQQDKGAHVASGAATCAEKGGMA
jgi:DNA modification methylase